MNDNLDQNSKLVIKVGTDDFAKFIVEGDVYVDKTMLIKEIIEAGDDVLLITRPRRWGKSLNLSMIHKFLEIEVDRDGNLLPEENRINSKLFLGGEVRLGVKKTKTLKPLKITKQRDLIENYLGQYPVIRISLKEINGDSLEAIEEQLSVKIVELFKLYRYLSNSSKIAADDKQEFIKYLEGKINSTELTHGLKSLSRLLYHHFDQKVFILIDEYDYPINSAYLKLGYKSEEYGKVLDLMRNFLGSALKGNDYLAKGVVTGILRIAKANLLSDLNNLTENSLFNEKFSSSYGFTEEEVEGLLKQVPVATSASEIKDWYNGYHFGGQIIYNPWSIMQCLSNNGKLEHYWLDSGGTNIIDNSLRSDEVQPDLQDLVIGKSIISEITKYINFDKLNSKSGLYSLLLLSGYLNPKVYDLENNIYELSIPNREVSYIYRNRLIEWLKQNAEIDKVKYLFFVQLLAQGKLAEFTETLKKIMETASFYQTGAKKAELFYSGFMVAAFSFLSTDYIIENEAEAGGGRADTILISKVNKGNNAIIVEYKSCESEKELKQVAEKGLKQINDKNYATRTKQYDHIKQIIKISISFFGKTCETAYEVENLEQ